MQIGQVVEFSYDKKTYGGIVIEVFPEKKGVMAITAIGGKVVGMRITKPSKVRDNEKAMQILQTLTVIPAIKKVLDGLKLDTVKAAEIEMAKREAAAEQQAQDAFSKALEALNNPSEADLLYMRGMTITDKNPE